MVWYSGTGLAPRGALYGHQKRLPFKRLIVVDDQVSLGSAGITLRPGEVYPIDSLEYVTAFAAACDWVGFRRIGEDEWSWFSPREPIRTVENALEHTRAQRVQASDHPNPQRPLTLTVSVGYIAVGIAIVVICTLFQAPIDHLLAGSRGAQRGYGAGSFAVRFLGFGTIAFGVVLAVIVLTRGIRKRITVRRKT